MKGIIKYSFFLIVTVSLSLSIDYIIASSPLQNDVGAVSPNTGKVAKSTQRYYIIAGTFSIDESAVKLVKTLFDKGYDASVISRNNMFSVCAGEYNNEEDARIDLKKIREDGIPDAWLLKK